MKAIINATVFTMAGRTLENAGVLFDEKILAVGEFEIPPGCEVIDAAGGYLLPGLIDAHSHLGLYGDSAGIESDDGNEDADPVTPQLRAIDGINPLDRGFEEARNAGITCVVTGPGSANVIGGQFAAVKTAGICIDDMILKAPAAMKFALGENPKSAYADKDQSPVTRMGSMSLIREALFKARDYSNAMLRWEENSEDNDKPEFDMKNDALMHVIRGEIPAKVHAHRADDICSALRLAAEFGIKVTIEHCTDGEAVAPILKRAGVPVMLGPTLTDRSKPELASLGFSTYKKLSDMGICVAIITDHPEITEENLLLCAQLAVRAGMDTDAALAGITCNAAKNCGIFDRVGSLETGKDADFALFDKMPLDFNARNMMSIINGDIVYKR